MKPTCPLMTEEIESNSKANQPANVLSVSIQKVIKTTFLSHRSHDRSRIITHPEPMSTTGSVTLNTPKSSVTLKWASHAPTVPTQF